MSPGKTIINKSIYLALGINLQGHKELLGLWIAQSEGAKFWLGVMTELQTQGGKDILIACVDGLRGFTEAIGSIYPSTQVQHYVIHQIRNSLKYEGSKHHKEFMADLKPVYRAGTIQAAETALDALEEKWGQLYPLVIRSWRNKWGTLSAYFHYPQYIRKPLYTTNAVEAVHRQFRKLTKTKGGFASETALLKLLYAGIMKASERRSMPIPNWGLTMAQLAIHFEGRLQDFMAI